MKEIHKFTVLRVGSRELYRETCMYLVCSIATLKDPPFPRSASHFHSSRYFKLLNAVQPSELGWFHGWSVRHRRKVSFYESMGGIASIPIIYGANESYQMCYTIQTWLYCW